MATMTTTNSDFSDLVNGRLDLQEVVRAMFLVLTEKERAVITKRFSLDSQPRQTLESIGKDFSVTRERIRQIEKIALGKLRRTVQTTELHIINQVANRVINEAGGLIMETKLVSSILEAIGSEHEVDGYIVRLALHINPDVQKSEKTNIYSPFWSLRTIDLALVDLVLSASLRVLKKKGDVMPVTKIIVQVRHLLGDKLVECTDPLIVSILEIDKRLKVVEDGFGLMSWRHINPRSIRDKAYIILKNERKPLHFVEIADKISTAEFDKKAVTVQAVHNELIRYEQFVLVGRGLYALKEFGYSKGTVTDVIELLLRKSSPMTKQEIIDGVLKQRHVKKGTISLNLQKHPQFVRVGRAVYELDESAKKKNLCSKKEHTDIGQKVAYLSDC